MNEIEKARMLIAAHYGDRRAKRSGVPLMNHIIEGQAYLEYVQAGDHAIAAFNLHPLLQNDSDLAENWQTVLPYGFSPQTIMLVMEYRNVANSYLPPALKERFLPAISPIPAVNYMLRADKLQNRKDFDRYFDHDADPDHSRRLRTYFAQWLSALGVSAATYQHMVKVMEQSHECS